jgi:hypothetical protein
MRACTASSVVREIVMAIEQNVLFRGKLPSRDDVNRAMQELDFPFSIDTSVSLDQQSGFMPMHFRETQTGVEFDFYEGRDHIDDLAACFDEIIEIDSSYDRCASVRWASDYTEGVAGMCVIATLAKLLNGTVLDEYEGLQDVEGALRIARENLATLLEHGGLPPDPVSPP